MNCQNLLKFRNKGSGMLRGPLFYRQRWKGSEAAIWMTSYTQPNTQHAKIGFEMDIVVVLTPSLRMLPPQHKFLGTWRMLSGRWPRIFHLLPFFNIF